MIRKLSLAAVAAVALGTTALAPTSASAWWGGHGWGHGWGGGWHHGYGWGGPRFYGAYSVCGWRWVATPWGPRRRWTC
jgi:hypothetical protein